MSGFVARLVAWIIGKLFGNAPAPTRAEIQAERAGAAEAKLQTKEASDAAVQDALDARRDAERDSLREPESLRAPDKYSRD